jgi:hypothetical protein
MTLVSVRIDLDVEPVDAAAPTVRDLLVTTRIRVHSGGHVEVVRTDAVPAAPAPPVRETKAQRQRRRLDACLAAGLTLPAGGLGRMPDGIAQIAALEGISRQALAADLKAALNAAANASGMQVDYMHFGAQR